jgi:hypothetical protein
MSRERSQLPTDDLTHIIGKLALFDQLSFILFCPMKPATEVSEEMVNLTQAVIETQQLRAWFYVLERLPVSVRETTFSEMAAEMRHAGEDSGLADAVASLANPKIYQSVLETIRARVGDSSPGTDR